MTGFASKALLAMVGAASAYAQLSPSAYRVLGQKDLQSNGLNRVEGVELRSPAGVALDSRDGQVRLYVCDSGNARVLAWPDVASYQIGDPPAMVLGQPGPGYSSPYGIGNKGMNSPLVAAVDPRTGDLYVADTGNSRILRFPSPFANRTRIEPDAVYGQPNFGTLNGGTSQTTLKNPRGVAVDRSGNLWVADSGNHRLLRFGATTLNNATPAADMVIGQRDYVGNQANQGGTPSASTLYSPTGITFDDQGNLFVADFGNTRVLRYTAPSPGATSIVADAVWGESNFISRGVPQQAAATTMTGPLGVAVDSSGNLYVATPLDNRVLVFSTGTTVGGAAKMVLGQADFATNSANTGVFPLASANTLAGPTDVKVAPDGNLFVADAGNHRVLSFAPGSKSAGRLWGQTEFSANGANQVKAGSINAAYKMAIDYSQAPYALYVSDIGNHRVLVWKDSTAFRNGDPADLAIGQPDLRTAIANVDTQAGFTPSRTSLSSPAGLALNPYDGTLYVADSGNNRVLRYPRPVDQTGRITPDAVIGQADFTSNTSAAVTAASLNVPTGLAFAGDGHLFVADTANNRVLEFPNGAGTGSAAVRVYGQPNMTSSIKPTHPTPQTLAAPRGLFVDAASNLYVADTGANRVMLFANTQDAPPYSAVAAYVVSGVFDGPIDIAPDSSGTIFIADAGNNRILALSSPISITGPTVIGVIGQPDGKGSTANWNAGNGLSSADSLYSPIGLYIDRQDTLYVGDAGNNRLLHFLKAATVVNAASLQNGAPVGRGGLATLSGAALASESANAATNQWPTVLANRKVVVNDEVETPLSLVSPLQVNFQAPSAAPLGTQRVAVRTADTGELIAGGNILIASVAPALFTASQNGAGAGVILNQDGTTNSPSNPAATGSSITLFGTGQGQVSPAVSDGTAAPGSPIASTVAVPTADGRTCVTVQPSVCVAIGSGFGTVQSSGLAPGYIGLWQIKVTIPQGIAVGGAVPLRVVLGGTPSNIVTVAVR
jgi:uncharacterized protein (TIGR03437 family)